MKLIAQFILNGLGLLVASIFIPGVNLTLSVENLALIAAIMTLANLVLKPILKFVLHPLVVITFGLFLIVINMGLLWVIDFFLEPLEFSNLTALFWTTIMLAVLNFIFIKTRSRKKVVVERIIEKHVDSNQ